VEPGTNVRVSVHVDPGRNWTTNVAFFPAGSVGGFSLTARSGPDDRVVVGGLPSVGPTTADEPLAIGPLAGGDAAKAVLEAAGPVPGRLTPLNARVAATVSATTM
jgi:hypothetical protein